MRIFTWLILLTATSLLRDKSSLNARFEKERNVRVKVSAMRPPSRNWFTRWVTRQLLNRDVSEPPCKSPASSSSLLREGSSPLERISVPRGQVLPILLRKITFARVRIDDIHVPCRRLCKVDRSGSVHADLPTVASGNDSRIFSFCEAEPACRNVNIARRVVSL